MDCVYGELVLENFETSEFHYFFFFPFTICCDNECICNAVSPLKWFISVSTRLCSPFCFGACSFLAFQLPSCLQHLFQYLVCCGMLRLCSLLAYFVSGRVDEQKDYSVII